MIAEIHGRCLEDTQLWGHSVVSACLRSTHRRERDEGASTGLFKQGSKEWAVELHLAGLLPSPVGASSPPHQHSGHEEGEAVRTGTNGLSLSSDFTAASPVYQFTSSPSPSEDFLLSVTPD